MDDLVILILIAVAVGIGALIKKSRAAKAREERERRIHPERPKRQETPWAKPAGTSPLAEVKRFFQEIQAEARKQQQPQRPPLPSRRVRRVRKVVRPPKPVAVKPEKPKEEPAVRRVVRPLATTEDTETTVVRPSAGQKPRVSKLSAILASDRKDLAKAVLAAEILGRPVAMKGSWIPRYRI